MLKEPSFGYLIFWPRKAYKCRVTYIEKKLGLKGKSWGLKSIISKNQLISKFSLEVEIIISLLYYNLH